MISIVISVLLFGLVHPISKILLDSGIPLSAFCLSYVGIRLAVLATSYIFQTKKISATEHWPKLLAFGLIGAGLQYFEFKGIEKGLSPGTVTFIMFSYPAWLAIFRFFKNKSQFHSELSTTILAIVGVFFVANGSILEISGNLNALFYPLLSSLFISLWIVQSHRLRNTGFGSIELSFYYDLVSFVALLILFFGELKTDFIHDTKWITPANMYFLAGYSVFVGLLPNFFFYLGSNKVSAYTAGIVLALEPIFSTLYSSVIWSHSFGTMFWIGCAMIVAANLPRLDILKKLQNLFYTSTFHKREV